MSLISDADYYKWFKHCQLNVDLLDFDGKSIVVMGYIAVNLKQQDTCKSHLKLFPAKKWSTSCNRQKLDQATQHLDLQYILCD